MGALVTIALCWGVVTGNTTCRVVVPTTYYHSLQECRAALPRPPSRDQEYRCVQAPPRG